MTRASISIWHRPLSRRTLTALVGLPCCALVLLCAWPYLQSVLRWLTHRSASWHSFHVALPFAWTQTSARWGNELSVEKPVPFFVRPDAMFSASRSELPSERVQDVQARWLHIHEPVSPTEEVAEDDTFVDITGQPLLCFKTSLARFHTMSLDCRSKDARWSVRFMGTRGEQNQAQLMLTEMLTQEHKKL